MTPSEVRSEHRPAPGKGRSWARWVCTGCGSDWPCAPIRAQDADDARFWVELALAGRPVVSLVKSAL